MNFAIRFGSGQRAGFRDQDIEDILTDSLERFAHRLKQVYLFIEDINGPRGGVDKQCRCVLHLRRMPPVVIQDQDESMHALIHRVANRAAYALSQQAGRKTTQTRRTRRRSVRITAIREPPNPRTTTAIGVMSRITKASTRSANRGSAESSISTDPDQFC